MSVSPGVPPMDILGRVTTAHSVQDDVALEIYRLAQEEEPWPAP